MGIILEGKNGQIVILGLAWSGLGIFLEVKHT